MSHTEIRFLASEIAKILQQGNKQNISLDSLDGYMTVKEAADFLGISPKTIANKSAHIPHIKSGKKIYFSRDVIQSYFRRRTKNAITD